MARSNTNQGARLNVGRRAEEGENGFYSHYLKAIHGNYY